MFMTEKHHKGTLQQMEQKFFEEKVSHIFSDNLFYEIDKYWQNEISLPCLLQ